MNAVSDSIALMVAAARIGFSDLASIYTIRTWLFGWFARLVTQVIFYSLFGFLLGSTVLAHYRAIGNSAALVAIEGMAVVIAVTRERGEGTLTLQLLAPYPYAFALTYLTRGICNLVVGIGSSTAAFAIAAILFRFPVTFPEVLLTPLFMAIMALASYCFGLALGAAVMARPTLQWLVINVGYLSVMTLGGVNVPVGYWPAALRIVASVLPLSHGLAAFRLLLNGGPAATIAIGLAAEFAVAAWWLACALCALYFAVWNGRRSGTLELSPSGLRYRLVFCSQGVTRNELELSDTFSRTREVLALPEYATYRTGSQLYVSRYGRELLNIAVGARAPGTTMSILTRIIWLCCSKPVLVIPLFRAFAAAGISEYELIATFIPEFANAGKGDVALHHLLTHTVPYCSLGIIWDGEKTLTRGERMVMAPPWDTAIKTICEMPLTAPPGEVVTYTPATNWMLLAEILERLTGRPHEDAVRAQVLGPLGMEHTSVYVTQQSVATLEYAPMWDLDESGEPQLEEVDTCPMIFGRWPGLACRGPARDMARPIECVAGWTHPEALDEVWRAKLIETRRSDLADPTMYGAEILWSLGLCVDPVRFGLPMSRRVVGHTGERSSMVFADRDTGITISFLSSGLVTDAADLARKRGIVRAVYGDLGLSLRGGR